MDAAVACQDDCGNGQQRRIMHVMIWYVDVIEIGDTLIFPANHINVTGKGCSIGLGREI